MKNFSARISELNFNYIEDLKKNFDNNRSKAIEHLINDHKKQELNISKLNETITTLLNNNAIEATEEFNKINNSIVKLVEALQEEG